MLRVFEANAKGLMPGDAQALRAGEGVAWLDLFAPDEAEAALVRGLGVAVPSLAEMEEIEISNRLYRDEGVEYLTVVLPGQNAEGVQIASPVTFILGNGRLITVRHHAPRPFETYPVRAGQSTAGCASAERLLLGLWEDIVSRLADHLEMAGRELDAAARQVFGEARATEPGALQATLRRVGLQGEVIGRVRLALVTLERALSFFEATERGAPVAGLIAGLMRDIGALSEHSDHLSARIGLTVDATLGMITLAQNQTVRIFSVVAVLFLPPTLVASIYGMNFAAMPELHQPWGYPAALAAMLASALGCFLVFKWKKWL